MGILEAAIVALTTLILTPGRLFYFDVTPKVAVLLAGTAVLLFLSVRQRTGRPPRLFTVLLLLNAASLIVSTLLSAHRGLSLYGSTWRRYGLVAQIAVMLFAWFVASGQGHARTILRGVALAGTLCGLYGIAQYFGWDPWIPQQAYHIGEGVWTIVRPPGTMAYSSYFATGMLLAIFLSLALAAMEKSPALRYSAYAAATVALVAMLLSGTRAAILGLAAGAAIWIVWRGLRIPRQMILAAAVLLVCGAGFYFSPAGRQMRSRARWFTEDPRGGARLPLWRDSLGMAGHRLIAGYGPEVFLGTFPAYESKELARAYPDFVHESPHNLFLDALLQQGLPGLAILVALCWIGFTAAWRSRNGLLAAALAAGIIAQFFTAFTVPTAVLFFTALGLILAERSESVAAPLPAAFRVAAPLVALALLYVAVRLTAADAALADSKRAMDADNLRASAMDYSRYDRWRLPGTSADLWYSRACINLAHNSSDIQTVSQAVTIAEDAAYRATETAEDPFNAWYNLAQINALHDDYRGTERALRQAIAAHPVWFKPHWLLAQVLQLQGRHEEAGQEAQQAVDLDGGKDAEVSQTLAQIRAAQ